MSDTNSEHLETVCHLHENQSAKVVHKLAKLQIRLCSALASGANFTGLSSVFIAWQGFSLKIPDFYFTLHTWCPKSEIAADSSAPKVVPLPPVVIPLAIPPPPHRGDRHLAQKA